jgi:hypothetical protein
LGRVLRRVIAGKRTRRAILLLTTIDAPGNSPLRDVQARRTSPRMPEDANDE